MAYSDIQANCFIQLKNLLKMGSCLQKIGFWVLHIWLCKSFSLNWAKTSFSVQDPKGYSFASWKIFPIKLKKIFPDKILHHISLFFCKWDDFWRSYWGVYPQRTTKKPSEILLLVPFQVWSSLLTLVHKDPRFWNTKMQISLEPLVQI